MDRAISPFRQPVMIACADFVYCYQPCAVYDSLTGDKAAMSSPFGKASPACAVASISCWAAYLGVRPDDVPNLYIMINASGETHIHALITPTLISVALACVHSMY